MRARYPDAEGFVERDGVKIAYEVFGSGGPWLVFVPIDPLVIRGPGRPRCRTWPATSRVITIDPRGNGRSVSYRPVETDGAAAAAALLSELI